MNNQNKIDIILPNFNSHLYIKQTINSILKQTYKNWKLIIVDDASDQTTIKILKKYKRNNKIKIYFLKTNKGDGYCRAFGIKKSKSKYIAFIDSDDIWKKNKLKLQYNFMVKNNYNFSFTYYSAFRLKQNIVKKIITPSNFTFESFIKNTSIATSSMMIKRSEINKIKLSKSPNFEDYYLKCQILKRTKFAYCLKKDLLDYRIKSNSLSSNKIRNLFWLWKINRNFNKLNFIDNLISVALISLNSIKKYGFK